MNTHKFDYTLFAIILALLTLGVIMIYSASAFMAQARWNQSAFFFKKQLIWFVLSVTVILLVSKIDYHHWKYLAWPAILISLFMLVFVFTQRAINGSHRWIFLASNSVQPSEIFKFAVVLFTALYLSRKQNMVDSLRALLWPWGAIVSIGLLLIALEPDLGMVLVIVAGTLVMLFLANFPLRYLLMSIAIPVAIVIVMVLGFDYNSNRLTSFVDPANTNRAGSYQINQSLLAIGSGGLVGKGLGRGSAKLFHLPESHTDFIIANLAEEGGFFLVSICLGLFFVVILHGLKIASLADDHFGFFLALGIVTILAISVIVNLGVATRLLPTTGMTLPFLSYGGSSLICSSFGIGVLLNISRHQCKESRLFVRRKP